MNIEDMLRQLYLELANIDQAVLALERLAALSGKRKKGSYPLATDVMKGRSRAAAAGHGSSRSDLPAS